MLFRYLIPLALVVIGAVALSVSSISTKSVSPTPSIVSNNASAQEGGGPGPGGPGGPFPQVLQDPVYGSGTSGNLAKWISSNTISDSLLKDIGGTVFIGINPPSLPNGSLFRVTSNGEAVSAIYGMMQPGSTTPPAGGIWRGVFGEEMSGVGGIGVEGRSGFGTGVRARSYTANPPAPLQRALETIGGYFGIHQTSVHSNTRNYFQNKVGIGTENPTEALEVVGNVKMGHTKVQGSWVVVNATTTNTFTSALCPGGKTVVSGGCELANGVGGWEINTSMPHPTNEGWFCHWNEPDVYIIQSAVRAHAICANIK